MDHRQRSGGELERDLLVNEIAVESDPGNVLASGGKIDTVESRPVDGGQTYWTGLAAGVKDATAQIEALHGAAGIANREDLRVSSGIQKWRDLIAAAPYQCAIYNNDRAERTATVDAHS